MKQKQPLDALFELARTGDEMAQEEIAEFFFPRVLALARRKLPSAPSPMVDHEDLAISVMRSLCTRVRDGRIDYLGDRQLFAAMKTILYRKAAKYWRMERSLKRSRDRTIGESELTSQTDRNATIDNEAIQLSSEMYLSDESIVVEPENEEFVRRVLSDLHSDIQGLFTNLYNQLGAHPRKVLLKLIEKDYSNKELAEHLGCAIVSIERYRSSIRRTIQSLAKGHS